MMNSVLIEGWVRELIVEPGSNEPVSFRIVCIDAQDKRDTILITFGQRVVKGDLHISDHVRVVGSLRNGCHGMMFVESEHIEIMPSVIKKSIDTPAEV